VALTAVLPYLYLGGYLDARDENNLHENGITHILNVKDSFRYPDPNRFSFLHVPLSDYGETSLEGILGRCSEFINNARDAEGKVLVHCALGSNRSPTVVIAYLMTTLRRPLLDCFSHVIRCREGTAPHERYLRQLQEMEERLFGIVTLEQAHLETTLEDLQELIQGLP
jgi:protein-tyrosine phosphatase